MLEDLSKDLKSISLQRLSKLFYSLEAFQKHNFLQKSSRSFFILPLEVLSKALVCLKLFQISVILYKTCQSFFNRQFLSKSSRNFSIFFLVHGLLKLFYFFDNFSKFIKWPLKVLFFFRYPFKSPCPRKKGLSMFIQRKSHSTGIFLKRKTLYDLLFVNTALKVR